MWNESNAKRFMELFNDVRFKEGNDMQPNVIQPSMALGIQLTGHLKFGNDMASRHDIARLREEFFTADRRVINVVGSIIYFQRYILGLKNIPLFTVTGVNRDWNKQDEIYGEFTSEEDYEDRRTIIKYRNKPHASVHMFRPSRGIDGIIKADPIHYPKIVEFVEKWYPYGDDIHKSVDFHDSGTGMHAHCQCEQGMGLNVLVEGKSKYV